MFVVVRQNKDYACWVGKLVEGSDTKSEIKLKNARLIIDTEKDLSLTSSDIYGPEQGRNKWISGIKMSDIVPMVSLKNVEDWAGCTLVDESRFRDFKTTGWKQQFSIVE